MPRYLRVRPGQLAVDIDPDEYNRRSAAIERLARLAGSGGVRVGDGPRGRTLDLPGPAGIWARLSGDANPYGFAEVMPDRAGGWTTRPGGLQGKGTGTRGDLSAYEVNGAVGLRGKVLWLVPGWPNDLRGQWVACCGTGGDGSACTRYCVTVADPAGVGLAGFEVTIRGIAAGVGWTASGTTDATGRFCATPPAFTLVQGAAVVDPTEPACSALAGFEARDGECTAAFTWCTWTLKVTTVDGDTGAPVSGVTLGSELDHCTALSARETVDGATHTFTGTSLTAVTNPFAGCVHPTPQYVFTCKDGYYDTCAGFGLAGCDMTAYCQADAEVDVTIWPKAKYVVSPCCSGCCAGVLAVIPKTLHATWSAPEPTVGSDSGASVELRWDGGWDGTDSVPGVPDTIRWVSDCAASGGFSACYTTQSNCLTPLNPAITSSIEQARVAYGSRQVVLELTYADGRCSMGITYTNYWHPSCVDDPTPVCGYELVVDRTSGETVSAPVYPAPGYGYCPWTQPCPGPYSPLPAPTGPTQFFPKTFGLPLARFSDPGDPLCGRDIVVVGSGRFLAGGVAARCSGQGLGTGDPVPEYSVVVSA